MIKLIPYSILIIKISHGLLVSQILTNPNGKMFPLSCNFHLYTVQQINLAVSAFSLYPDPSSCPKERMCHILLQQRKTETKYEEQHAVQSWHYKCKSVLKLEFANTGISTGPEEKAGPNAVRRPSLF